MSQFTKAYKVPHAENIVQIEKDPATVIPENTFIALDSNKLAIQAVAGSAKIGMIFGEAEAGADYCLVIADREAVFLGYGDRPFAETDRSAQVDLVVNSTYQMIDLDASTTDVFTVQADYIEGINVVGQQNNIAMKITAGKHLLD